MKIMTARSEAKAAILNFYKAHAVNIKAKPTSKINNFLCSFVSISVGSLRDSFRCERNSELMSEAKWNVETFHATKVTWLRDKGKSIRNPCHVRNVSINLDLEIKIKWEQISRKKEARRQRVRESAKRQDEEMVLMLLRGTFDAPHVAAWLITSSEKIDSRRETSPYRFADKTGHGSKIRLQPDT